MTRQRQQRRSSDNQKLNIILGMQIVILLILIISIAGLQEAPGAEGVDIAAQLIGSGPDSDGDGFSDLHEQYLGTNWTSACPVTSNPNDEAVDAWPPDFNDDRKVTLTDLASFIAPVRHINTVAGQTGFSDRWDLIADGKIWVQDMTALLAPVRYYGTSCGPPTNTTTTTTTIPFNFTISVAGSMGNVAQGSNISTPVAATLKQGTPKAVLFALHTFSPPNVGMISTTFLPNFCIPNPTCTVTMYVNANSTAPTGTYTLLVRGSGGGTSVYNSTTLNVISGSTTTTLSMPDLAASLPGISGNASANFNNISANTLVRLNGSIYNLNPVSSPSSFAYFTLDGPAGVGNFINSVNIGPLSGYSGVPININWTVNSALGAHQLFLCADGLNNITESNEANNCKSISFTVS